jgi:hypothetical protein
MESFPVIPSPVGNGWCKEDEMLAIDWSDSLPAPEAVMELLSCDCAKECVEETCLCLQNNQRCTYLCKLVTCSNQKDDDENNETDISEDSDDDESDDEDQEDCDE